MVKEIEETRRKHEQEREQGDDIFVHLEKERERLNKEVFLNSL